MNSRRFENTKSFMSDLKFFFFDVIRLIINLKDSFFIFYCWFMKHFVINCLLQCTSCFSDLYIFLLPIYKYIK